MIVSASGSTTGSSSTAASSPTGLVLAGLFVDGLGVEQLDIDVRRRRDARYVLLVAHSGVTDLVAELDQPLEQHLARRGEVVDLRLDRVALLVRTGDGAFCNGRGLLGRRRTFRLRAHADLVGLLVGQLQDGRETFGDARAAR